jgi:hypothetical protein
MAETGASQTSGEAGASQPKGVVAASQVDGTVGARPAQPQANLWTPAELGSDLALWLDVWDSPFDVREDGGTQYVERWGDLSGDNEDATQTTGSRQPTLGTLIEYDGGSKDKLTSPEPSDESNTSLTALCFFRVDDTDPLQVYVQGGRTLIFVNNGLVECNIGSDGGSCSVGLSTGHHITVARWNLATGRSEIWLNGVQENNTTTSPDRITSQTGIGNIGTNNLAPYGAIGGVTITDSYVSGSDVDKLFGHLAHKADRNGIPEPLQNLPGEEDEDGPHPYKYKAPRI